MIPLLLILVALLSPPDPHLVAYWASPGVTVQWTQTTRGCLAVEHATGERVFISCYERYPATIRVELGHVGPLDGHYRPETGDIYVLQTGGQTYRTLLAGQPIYLPAVRA